MFMQWFQIASSVRRVVALLREDKDMLIIMMKARRVNSLRRPKSIGKTEILARRFEKAMLQRAAKACFKTCGARCRTAIASAVADHSDSP